MKSKAFLTTIVSGAVLIFFNANLAASPVDLSTFQANPQSAVQFFDGGFSATINEDPNSGVNPVSLKAPLFAILAGAMSLEFDYKLYVAGSNRDFFDFYIGDASVPVFEAGGSGLLTASGHFTYDLAGLSGTTVPVIFQLMSDWGDNRFESYVTMSNVHVSLVPIPATLLLLGSGLLWLIRMRRKNRI